MKVDGCRCEVFNVADGEEGFFRVERSRSAGSGFKWRVLLECEDANVRQGGALWMSALASGCAGDNCRIKADLLYSILVLSLRSLI